MSGGPVSVKWTSDWARPELYDVPLQRAESDTCKDLRRWKGDGEPRCSERRRTRRRGSGATLCSRAGSERETAHQGTARIPADQPQSEREEAHHIHAAGKRFGVLRRQDEEVCGEPGSI